MDLIGEIVEKEVEVPTIPVASQESGFPSLDALKNKKKSKFASSNHGKKSSPAPRESKPLSEAERIDKENKDRLSNMSEDEILSERKELLDNLDPKLIQSLMKRTEARSRSKDAENPHSHDESSRHVHAEGFDGWIGGKRTADGIKDLSSLDKDDVNKALNIQELQIREEVLKEESKPKPGRSVQFSDSVEIDEGPNRAEETSDSDSETAPDGYQINNEDETHQKVHFLKPKQPQDGDLDLNDPKFFDKLHEKYYPDLPKETNKLAWMQTPMPDVVPVEYASISEMRFDFNGDLVDVNGDDKSKCEEVPTYMGLHHHSDDPHLPGYTFRELGHLARSTMASQRCLSIRTLGRVLHKLCLHKYNIMPLPDNAEDEVFTENIKSMMASFEKMMWQWIEELRIIESLMEAADEKKTSNISVRNYALEALWLWKNGGGTPDFSEEENETIKNIIN